MAGTARTAAARSAMLNYIPPEGASEANVARAREVCALRRLRLRPGEASKETLEGLAANNDPDRRRWKARQTLHNSEFLVALILAGEQRHEAIPPEWQEPSEEFQQRRKRTRAVAFAPAAAASLEPAVHSIDFMDPDRYRQVLSGVIPARQRISLFDLCSLPDSFRRSTALVRKPCFNIKLWKDYATSTPAQQEEHLEKWSRRLQKSLSGEPNSSITAAFSEYEVVTLPLFLEQFTTQVSSSAQLSRSPVVTGCLGIVLNATQLAFGCCRPSA